VFGCERYGLFGGGMGSRQLGLVIRCGCTGLRNIPVVVGCFSREVNENTIGSLCISLPIPDTRTVKVDCDREWLLVGGP
jgi:hypothetical protein